jgi:hypothetical protein
MMAPLFLDLVWPFLVLGGIEQVEIAPGDTAFTPLRFVSYPWSHSLLMACAWAAIVAILYRARTGYGRGALVVAVGVVSHWVLDFASHRPDMPLYPGGGPLLGLGLWNSRPATVVVEGAMFLAGLWMYVSSTRAKNAKGHLALWSFVAILLLFYVLAAQGKPPPSARAVAMQGVFAWLFVPWAWWIDRNRIKNSHAIAGIQKGIESFRRDKGLPAREALANLKRKHRI